MLADDQQSLLTWVLDALDGEPPPLPPWPVARLQAAGMASGLTALIGALAEQGRGMLPAGWAEYVAEQQGQVAARQGRFDEVLPTVLAALHSAGIAAIPVKGAVIASTWWPVAGTRPMSDIDLIVAPGDRRGARDALVAAGFPLHGSRAAEDVFIAWPGDTVTTCGESAGHPGKIEVHPGIAQNFHHYLVDDSGVLTASAAVGELAGVSCRRLDNAALAMHVLAHLSAGVVRAEVRPTNVVDALCSFAALDPAARDRCEQLVARLDARLVDPGLWLLGHYRSNWLPGTTGRLGRGATRQLAATAPESVLRAGRRLSVRWRLSFAVSWSQRARLVGRALVPPRDDLDPSGAGGSLLVLHADRIRRSLL